MMWSWDTKPKLFGEPCFLWCFRLSRKMKPRDCLACLSLVFICLFKVSKCRGNLMQISGFIEWGVYLGNSVLMETSATAFSFKSWVFLVVYIHLLMDCGVLRALWAVILPGFFSPPGLEYRMILYSLFFSA